MLKNLKETLSHFDRDDVLESLGLERKHNTAEAVMPALAIFGAGVLVGVGLGMIFAPRTGVELRGQLQSQFKNVQQKVRGDSDGLPTTNAPVVPNRPA